MELGSPIILVSAFGRGHWLAVALAQEGIRTTLVDVSAKLGVWPAEDIEGPFGFFRDERVSEAQVDRLYSEDPFDEVANGFSLWLSQGPVEFKGPLTKFSLENLGLSTAVKNLLYAAPNELANKESKLLYRNLDSVSFAQSWLLHFAHQYAGTTYMPNARAAKEGEGLPLLSSFFVRRATRAGLERSFEWLRSRGVEVVEPHQIVDASFGPGKSVTGLEISGEQQGLFHLNQLVWMLTSEESYFLNERLGKYFFPEGALESEWCWVRYRVGLKQCFERDSLPLHTVILDDVYSPWTHENLMVLQRTSLPEQFDVWMRIPTVQRFNKEYLTNRSLRMQQHISRRMSLSDPQVLSFPQEYYYTYAQLGAPRYPVFSEKQKSRRGKVLYSNLHLDGPEEWSHYAWTASFAHNELIQSRIVSWWKDKLLREQKEKRKEQEQ